jgi:hypothetical protein
MFLLGVKVLPRDEITREILVNRQNKYVLVEVTEGVAIDDEGNGYDPLGYISYRYTNAKKGDKVKSIFVYDNDNGEDTVNTRIDFVNGSIFFRCF